MIVNQEQLIDILAETDVNNVTILYESPVKMNKTDNPFFTKEGRSMIQVKSVTRRCVKTFGFGENYTEKVKKALKNAGSDTEYKASGKTWQETVVPDKVIKHKGTGKYYINVYDEYIPNHPMMEKFIGYFVDGEPATEDEIEDIKKFEIKTNPNVKKQEEAGLSYYDQIWPRTIPFDHIISIVIGTEMYELK